MAVVQLKNRQTKPFVKNSKVIFTLALGGKIRSGKVVLAGNVNLANGDTNGVKQGEGGPIGLIRRIIVTATPAAGSRYPGGRIVDASPRSLLRYAIFQHNGKFIGDQGGSSLGAGAAGDYPVYLSIPLYFADATLRNSYSTALNTDAGTYASVQVEIDTADIAACFAGNNRDEDYSGLTLQWVDDRIDLPGVDTVVRYQEDHVMLIAATRDRALDEAMPQDGNFESWLIMGEQSSALTLSDGLLRKVTIDGPTLGLEMWAQGIRQRMLDDEWLDPAETATGLYFIDFTDGSLGNTVAGGSLSVKLDVTNVSGANADDLSIFTRRDFAPAAKS